jgi:ergothioneine biosynthesis protein EgtB
MSTVTSSKQAAGESLLKRFRAVRDFTMKLCEPLTAEDCCIQAAPFASPTRWHLAHTSWFFETFLLKSAPGYQVFDSHYEVLFNSYYNTVGEQFPRPRRGLLSRPSLAEVYDYRRHIDDAVTRAFETSRIEEEAELANIIEWGIQHEQQHQELILTDVKYLLWQNPLLPAYQPTKVRGSASGQRDGDEGLSSGANGWQSFSEGLYEIGHAGPSFAYDNESPRHRVFLETFQLATCPISSGEYLSFIEDDGYRRAELWLSDGWNFITSEKLTHPLYWFRRDDQWQEFTLAGPRPLDLDAPVCHLSYYEADAYSRWAGARLPTEAEWEVAGAGAGASTDGHFVDTLLAEDRPIHPSACQSLFGNVWQWTASAYLPYPGYQPPHGALGEYNGKFMSGQMVLRGGSCATPSTHIRATYRNFFPPDARWQFSGLRLAR